MEKLKGKEKVRQAVVMLIYNEKHEALFTKRVAGRKFLPNVWALPAGHIEEGETYEEATIREAKEELNIEVNVVQLKQVVEEPSGDKTQIHLVEISATDYQGTPSITSDEFKEVAWMTLEDFYERFTDKEIGSTLRHIRPQFKKTKL